MKILSAIALATLFLATTTQAQELNTIIRCERVINTGRIGHKYELTVTDQSSNYQYFVADCRTFRGECIGGIDDYEKKGSVSRNGNTFSNVGISISLDQQRDVIYSDNRLHEYLGFTPTECSLSL